LFLPTTILVAVVPFERLNAPLTVGPMRVRNRVVVAPMERNYANADGSPSERTIAHYARIAAGGAGWIDIESTFVDPMGRGRTHQLGLHDDTSIPGFARLAEIAHRHDVRIGVELHHAGRNTSPGLIGTTPVAPSPVECPEAGSGIPHELRVDEIEAIVARYARAAARAAEAGLDAVELHSAHGYLPLAFLSPLTNLRTDSYGGTLENRMRFALQVMRAIREAVPERVAIGCRFSAEELLPGGLTLADTVPYARALVAAGADYLSISAGVYASFKWIIPPMDTPSGWLLPRAGAIREAVDVPVIGVSRFTSPAAAEQALEQGSLDLVAFGRAFLTDPQWPRKAFEGRVDEQVSCIGCNQGCVERIADQRDVTCLVNPVCGRELELVASPADQPRTILVVGAGPAGMEAARVAAERGHRVVLVDQAAGLGGQLRAARELPHRPGWSVFIEEAGRRLARAGVDVWLGRTLDDAFVDDLRPDTVVLAIGATFVVPPPSSAPRHVSPVDLIERGVGGSRRALVLGSDAVALGIGEWLAAAGCSALIVAQRAAFVEGGQPGLLERVGALPGVVVRADRELRVLDADGVTIVRSGAIGPLFEETFDPVDIVVDTSTRASAAMPDALAGIDAGRIHAVGDCVRPQTALEAIYAGMQLGLAL
jgi:2,4-dienoyl-CoA reductase-like NADH-dependent reductase (Old Yellow Enzyme family)